MAKYKVGDKIEVGSDVRTIIAIGKTKYFYRNEYRNYENSMCIEYIDRTCKLVKPEPECLGEVAYHLRDCGRLFAATVGSQDFKLGENGINYTRVTLRGNKVYKYE